MATKFSQTAAYIWSLADLMRGDFKQSQYGRAILLARSTWKPLAVGSPAETDVELV
jgi:hypothetical protein